MNATHGITPDEARRLLERDAKGLADARATRARLGTRCACAESTIVGVPLVDGGYAVTCQTCGHGWLEASS